MDFLYCYDYNNHYIQMKGNCNDNSKKNKIKKNKKKLIINGSCLVLFKNKVDYIPKHSLDAVHLVKII